MTPARRMPLSERLETSAIGKTLLSAFVLLVLASVLATHLPSSAMRRAVDDPARRLLHTIGLEQQWAVFAPDPRQRSLELQARITYADGSTETWIPPDGSPLVENLRFYRWRKWMERIRGDDHRSLWAPTARWIADDHGDGPSPVVSVELVRRFHDNAVEGEQPEWQEVTFCRLDPQAEVGCE